MGLLGDIYSAIDTQKRRLGGLLADPAGTLALGVTRFGEDQGGLLNTFANAYPMAGNKTVLNTPDQIEQFRREVADAAANQAMAAATVWHGSPHKFDAFDSSKIGTGEGAQAYGHGLYLAESPQVAKDYQERLGKLEFASEDAAKKYDPAIIDAISRDKRYNTLDDILKQNKQYADHAIKTGQNNFMADMYNAVKNGDIRNGHLYKVDLPDEHISRMLDWDKPLSQQLPHVKSAISNAAPDMSGTAAFLANKPETTIEQLYKTLQQQHGNDATNNFFKSMDVPGIKYLDGGSRGAGQGTQNYVVFPGNEGLLSILERNGVPVQKPAGLLGMGQNAGMKTLPYQTQHKPMTIEGGAAPLHDLAKSFGEDVYGKDALQFYGSGDPREKYALQIMNKVKGNPDATVTIYRGVPDGVDKINPGDWVTLHPKVAEDYTTLTGQAGKVIKMEVPAKDITSWADSLLEFGYHPK